MKQTNSTDNSNNSKVKNDAKSSITTEREKFTNVINAHFEFLKRNKSRGKIFLRDHRNIALHQIYGYLYDALLQRTITHKEYRDVLDEASKTLSWENITGVKQLTIFDELPNYE